MVARYIPDRGDLVWLNFDPSVGREQQGRRPAIVLSLADYNSISDLAILMPITSRKTEGDALEKVARSRHS